MKTGTLFYSAVTAAAGAENAARTEAVEVRLPCEVLGELPGILTVKSTDTDEEGRPVEQMLTIRTDDPEGIVVNLFRGGAALRCNMTFARGETFPSRMETAYGDVTMTLRTDLLRLELEDAEDGQNENRQLSLSLCYRFLEAPEEVHEVYYRVNW